MRQPKWRPEETRNERSASRPAMLVAAGILLSRIAGLVRERALAHFLGVLPEADAFRAALRIPNFLQNLFGEGVLSASFIPVYSRLLASSDQRGANRVASVVGSLLGLVTALLVVLGIFSTPLLIDLIAPGFTGETRQLTIRLVQILFPGVGALVMSAWCLGILNSHGRFFLSYSAPVLWNLFIIAGLFIFGSTKSLSNLVVYVAWSSVLGSLAQLLVQVPTVLRLSRRLRFSLNLKSASVRSVLINFVPVFMSRGIVQLSAYIDNVLASLLPSGSVALLNFAQTIGLLPVSLFGMSISAAELPAMSKALAGDEKVVPGELAKRLSAALRRMAFLTIPAATSFFVFGDTLAGLIYQSGRFTRSDTLHVWALLIGSGVGLVASTSGRLCSSAFYALRDTQTPLRFAIVRVVLTVVLGYLSAFPIPKLLHLEPSWGLAGLPASAGVAGWLEFLLLRNALRKRVGQFSVPGILLCKLWGTALVSAAITYPLKLWTTGHPAIAGIVVLPCYGILYIVAARCLRIPEADALLGRFLRRR
ncbi:MAG TPA: murein biosynthesis integral membrane protein MurJ [Chthoniobacterales bacterium]|nr:murein biosynthesis integral membrane protein MurJ [Chthoniobacterales bacterium]